MNRTPGRPDFFAALGSPDRSVGRILIFLVAWLAISLIPAALAWLVGAYVGAWIDQASPMLEGTPWSVILGNRLAGGMTFGSGMGILAGELAPTGLKLALLGGLLLAAAKVYRRPLKSWLTAANRWRWRHYFVGATSVLALASGALWAYGLAFVPGYAPTWLNDDPASLASAAIGLAALAILGSLGEEVLFRGWLMQQVAAFIRRPAVPIIVSALLFALLHGDWQLGRMAQLVSLGLGLGWAAWRLGGLELAAGAHVAFNVAASTFSPRRFELIQTAEGAFSRQVAPTGMDWLLVAAVSLTPLIVAAFVAGLDESS